MTTAKFNLDPAARQAWISAGAPILALVGVVLVLALLVVANFARIQDRNFELETQRLVQGAINGHVRAVSNLTLDYAMWDDAYERVTLRWDAEWIESNFYSAVANALVVMRATGETRYSWSMEGETATLPADAVRAALANVTLPAPDEAANENLVTTATFMHEGNLVLLALAPITLEEPEARAAGNARRPTDYLVLVDVLNPADLAALGRSLDLEGLRFGPRTASSNLVTLAPQPHDADFGVLSWRNERPGSAAFAGQMAPIALCLLVVGALTLLVSQRLVRAHVRQAARAEAALESSSLRAEFIATMSHELRTPLNAIIGYSELIEETAEATPSGNAIRIDAGRVLTAAKHLRQLVTDILDHSRIDSGRLRLSIDNVSVIGALAEAAEFAEQLAEAQGLDFSVADDTSGADVAADDMRLRQCLINLIGNAVKFTRDGHVRVRARLEQRADGAFVVFDVTDTGIGNRPRSRACSNHSFKPMSRFRCSTAAPALASRSRKSSPEPWAA